MRLATKNLLFNSKQSLMSIKNFLSHLWQSIKTLFDKVEKEVKKDVVVAISVVQRVKAIVDSPVADVVTALIPGSADDKVKELLRSWLPKVIIELSLVESVANIEDQNAQLQAILDKLKLSSDETKNAFYHSLASLVLQKLSDGKLSWSDAVAIAEYYYQNHVKTA
jgi:hypothetical protein